MTVEGHKELKEALRFPGWDEPFIGEKLAALKPGESIQHNGFTIKRIGRLAESGKAPGSNPEVGDTRGGSNPPPSAKCSE